MNKIKAIGVICYDNDDFEEYIDFYLKNIKILNKRRTVRKTEKILYVAVHNRLGFCGVTFDYYIFTGNAYKNKNIIEIVERTRTGSNHYCT